MKAADRRKQIIEYISAAKSAVSAGALSEKFGVSRQVIVQDIAILRANGHEVISTSRGYVLDGDGLATRVFKCRHTLDQLVDEAEIVISHGGRIEDVSVSHRVYGRIAAHLGLTTVMHAEELYRSLKSGASKPLMSVTDGYHYHTVCAESEQKLDAIESALRSAGYLIEI